MADDVKKTMEEEVEEIIIPLEFEDGAKEECRFIAIFENDGKEYMVLETTDGTDDVYFFGYEEVGEDEYVLNDIETDEEFNKAVEAFDKLLDEQKEN